MTHRVLSIAHSYCVSLNRRLAWEMQRAGGGAWEIHTVAPRRFPGDLSVIETRLEHGEPCSLTQVRTWLNKPIHLMFYGPEVKSALRQKWSLVHCWEEPYILAGAQLASWTPRETPFVFWTAQNIAKRYPPPFAAFERYCLQRCSGWMAAGHTVVRTLIQRGYDHKPWRILPLGVDTERFRHDRQLRSAMLDRMNWAESGPPVVGYLGRFVPEKGLPMLMRALEQVRTPFRALFVGGGPMESVLRDWSRRFGDQVRVITGIPHEEVPFALNAMDMICAPSQTTRAWREQFGRMLVEAFACGVPVIASDSGEIPWVVRDTGIICPEAGEQDWVAALERMLGDASLRRLLSEAGLDRARTEFSWSNVARQHLQFFSSLL